MEDTIEITGSELAAAFEVWARRDKESPTGFAPSSEEPHSYGVDCATYLFKLIREMRRAR